MEVKVVAIVNPTKFDDLAEARRRLNRTVEELGFEPPDWVLTTAEDPGAGQAHEAVAAGADLVLSWGGDGTVTSVAEGLRETGTPLGLLPGGTGNLLARNLEVPLDLTPAVRIAYQGKGREIDLLAVSLGRGEKRISTVMCGLGWDAAMMDVTEQAKSRLGWGAYVWQAARTIQEHPVRMRVRVDDGEEMQFHARTCLIANVGTLVGGVHLLPEAQPDDGRLEVLVFDPSTLADYARTSWEIARRKPTANDPVRTLFRGTKVVVSTHRSLKRQVDGDLVQDGYGFVVRLLPRALLVNVTQ